MRKIRVYFTLPPKRLKIFPREVCLTTLRKYATLS